MRTKERGPPARDDPLDRRSTLLAVFAGALIDAVSLLEAAFLAVGGSVIRKRRSVESYRAAERRFDGAKKPRRAITVQLVGVRKRMNAGCVQRFVAVYVSQTRDAALIQQQRLDLSTPRKRVAKPVV